MSVGRFFPGDYLNQGSRGPAVTLLQIILRVAGFDPRANIQFDGEYGPVTADAVRRLQDALGVETDGNFGPNTRRAFQERYNLNVNELPVILFLGKTEAAVPS
jgi:peptidoglycan hydrolase-like protein with peptidoglycan-binding domain